MISKESLLKQSRELQYKPEILEKVYRLLITLEQIMQVPFLRERLVLKGGTALNLFYFNDIPRLSVDIDLNYIGHIERAKMMNERKIINEAIEQILQQNKFELYRNPGHHAGGKMVWRYPSLLGQGGSIEIDLNYMYRVPLWSCIERAPKLQLETSNQFLIPVLDIHELAAGKLSALFTRQASRDLFDTHHLLTKSKLNNEKLRLTFVVYMAMAPIDLTSLNKEALRYDVFDIKNKLLPVLRQQKLSRKRTDLDSWALTLLKEAREALSIILPLNDKEIEFIKRIKESGEINPELITNDTRLQQIIPLHPAIKWAAFKSNKES